MPDCPISTSLAKAVSHNPQSTVSLTDSIYTLHEGDCLVSPPVTKMQATSSKKTQVIAMKSQSKRSHRTSPYYLEKPKRKCMTKEQLNILNPYYAKNNRPARDDIELLAEAIDM